MIVLCKQMFKEEERKRTEIISFRKASRLLNFVSFLQKFDCLIIENDEAFNVLIERRIKRIIDTSITLSRWLIPDFRGFSFSSNIHDYHLTHY